MKIHVESIYGFYHGQDPRTFEPDVESCSDAEISHHRTACEAAERGAWVRDDSGCHFIEDEQGIRAIITKSSFGIGVYQVVLSSDGEFIRDATWEDMQREGEWEEEPR